MFLSDKHLSWSLELVSCLLVICLTRYYALARKKNYFPSPSGIPVIGHLLQVPTLSPWLKLAQWGRTFGDVIHLQFLGRPAIILNGAEVTHELLDLKGSNFSDRPITIYHGEMMNWKNLTWALPYGDRLRKQRRYMHEYMDLHVVSSLQPLQIEHVRSLLYNLKQAPEFFEKHVYRMSAAIIMKLAYGFDSSADGNDLMDQISVPTSRGAKAGVPCLSPPDLLPFLRHVPPWFPGASYVREANEIRILSDKVINDPFQKVKTQKNLGIARPSFVFNMLNNNQDASEADENEMKHAAAMLFGAGVETSEAALLTFFLMVATNTNAAKRAQEEIDDITKRTRLPTLDDRPNLPYVDCLLKEIFRINPPIPLSIPHQSIKEESFREKVIPARSMIIPNIWHMMRDDRFFTDPHQFNPSRFLEKVKSERTSTNSLQHFRPDDPSSLVFGFGRRICPGRFLADSNIWLAISNVLAVFDILPPLDPVSGKEVLPSVEFAGGLSNKPKPFGCRIVPRNTELAVGLLPDGL